MNIFMYEKMEIIKNSLNKNYFYNKKYVYNKKQLQLQKTQLSHS